MYEIPLPSKESDAARALGLTATDFSVDNPADEFLVQGARCYFPPIENAWKLGSDGEADTVANIRSEIIAGFGAQYVAIAKADERITTISKDKRFSDSGRHEQMKEQFLAAFNGAQFRQALRLIPRQYDKLVEEYDRHTKPPRLVSSDAAGAIADSELRGILRSKPQLERIATLWRLSLNEPENPLLIAALRSSPEALEIDPAMFTELKASYGVANWSIDLADIWTCACYLQSWAGLCYYGLQRLGSSIGEAEGVFVDTVRRTFDTPGRAELTKRIEGLVSAANRANKIVRQAIAESDDDGLDSSARFIRA